MTPTRSYFANAMSSSGLSDILRSEIPSTLPGIAQARRIYPVDRSPWVEAEVVSRAIGHGGRQFMGSRYSGELKRGYWSRQYFRVLLYTVRNIEVKRRLSRRGGHVLHRYMFCSIWAAVTMAINRRSALLIPRHRLDNRKYPGWDSPEAMKNSVPFITPMSDNLFRPNRAHFPSSSAPPIAAQLTGLAWKLVLLCCPQPQRKYCSPLPATCAIPPT